MFLALFVQYTAHPALVVQKYRVESLFDRQIQRASGFQVDIDLKQLLVQFERGSQRLIQKLQTACHEVQFEPVHLHPLEVLPQQLLLERGVHLVFCGEVDPHLKPVEQTARVFSAFVVYDATRSNHPLHFAASDDTLVAH